MSVIYKNHEINREYSNLSKKSLLILWSQTINKPYKPRYLLSLSAKIIKGENFGYLTGVCYMTPAFSFKGGNTCSHHKLGD